MPNLRTPRLPCSLEVLGLGHECFDANTASTRPSTSALYDKDRSNVDIQGVLTKHTPLCEIKVQIRICCRNLWSTVAAPVYLHLCLELSRWGQRIASQLVGPIRRIWRNSLFIARRTAISLPPCGLLSAATDASVSGVANLEMPLDVKALFVFAPGSGSITPC